MFNDVVTNLDPNELPPRVRADRKIGMELLTRSTLARGGDPAVALADEGKIANWAQFVNHSRALEDRGISGLGSRLKSVAEKGANPFADELLRKIPEALAPALPSLTGILPSAGIRLADAVQAGANRGQVAETFVTPLRTEDFMPWLGRGQEPVMGQQQMYVQYVDSTGKAGPAASVGAIKKLGTVTKQANAPVRIIACATDVDVIRLAEAAFNANGGGYDASLMNETAAKMAMQEALADVAINGDASVGWNGILSTGGIGKSREITDYALINVGTADPADLAEAVSNAIADAVAGVSKLAEVKLDTVVITDTMFAQLGKSAPSGGTYLAVLMAHWQVQGIVNWHVSDAIRSEDKTVQRLIVTRSADSVYRPRLHAPTSPQVFTYQNGPYTETYYFAPCAGVWVPFQPMSVVINMIWSA